MDTTEINKAFKDKGLNFKIFAKTIGCSYSTVRKICLRETHSKRIAQLIAAAIELPVKDVFPDKPQYWHEQKSEAEKIADLQKKLAEVA